MNTHLQPPFSCESKLDTADINSPTLYFQVFHSQMLDEPESFLCPDRNRRVLEQQHRGSCGRQTMKPIMLCPTQLEKLPFQVKFPRAGSEIGIPVQIEGLFFSINLQVMEASRLQKEEIRVMESQPQSDPQREDSTISATQFLLAPEGRETF